MGLAWAASSADGPPRVRLTQQQVAAATQRMTTSVTEPVSAQPPAQLPVPMPVALSMYAKVLAAKSLAGAGHALVASLTADHGYSHAWIGLREGGTSSMLADSGHAVLQAGDPVSQQVLGAMDEAIEQSVSIAFPAAEPGPAGGAEPIRFEHRQLHALLNASVATVPLGAVGEVLGALTVERPGNAPIGTDELLQLERLMLLAVPALRWMQQSARPWHRRAGDDLLRLASGLRQPARRPHRRVLAAGAVVLAFLALAPLQHEVSGRARLEGAEQRVLAAPTDGFVKTAHVRPGDRVRAGDALVDLVDSDLRLERERWSSQQAQHENAYAAAMAKSDRAGASTSLARIGEAQAQLALVDEQLLRGRVVAPFDALVIQGDLAQSIGAPVRQGDALITLATTGRARVIVEVDEVDIGRVQLGQHGSLGLSSLPWDREALVVERIAPIAKAVEGRNVFEVEARLESPRAELRPGLLGRADVVVGRRPLLWSWSGHALDRLRVAWWAWLG